MHYLCGTPFSQRPTYLSVFREGKKATQASKNQISKIQADSKQDSYKIIFIITTFLANGPWELLFSP